MEEHEVQRSSGRARYRLDAQSLSVLDAEIAKLTVDDLMVPLTRPQALRALVVRAVLCKCDAQKRKLSPIAVSSSEANRRRCVEADGFVRAVLQTEGLKLADGGQYVSLNAHQVLRMLLMRAARCRCEMASQAA